jgi:hypothetical protein
LDSIPGRGKRFFFSPQLPDRIWLIKPPLGAGRLFTPEVKRPGSEDDYSPPYTAEVKNYEGITPLPYTYSWRGA